MSYCNVKQDIRITYSIYMQAGLKSPHGLKEDIK